MEQVAKRIEPSDDKVTSIAIPETKGPLEEVNFITKDELPALVLQMQLDIYGLKLEEDEFKLGNLKIQLKKLEDSIVPTITLQQEAEIQKQIKSVKKEISEIENAIAQKNPNLKIARLPEQRRMNLFTKRFLLRSLGFLPGLVILTWDILNIIFTSFGFGNLCAFGVCFLVSMLGKLAFEDFSFELYLNPAAFFKQPDPKAIAQNPTEMNKLSHEWLTKVGLHRIEQAIERFGHLAGEWDNKAAELQALYQQAVADKNEEAKEKVTAHIERLGVLHSKLQERLNTLQKSREQLLSLKTYDMKLMEIEAEIKEFSSDVEEFLSQSAILFRQIRDTVNLALSAEVESLVRAEFDPDFNRLQKLIERQVQAKGLQVI